jgi:hypothetical protein
MGDVFILLSILLPVTTCVIGAVVGADDQFVGFGAHAILPKQQDLLRAPMMP